MRRQLLAVISIALMCSAAAAETAPRLERLEVTLWPEYDRPAVLVMLHGWLAADASLPAIVYLPMPARAGRPHAVAKRAPEGTLLVAEHSVEVEGDRARVKVMTDVPEIRLEYYVDLPSTDPRRRYVFEWPGGLDVERVTYEVMQPVGAEDFSVEPAPGTRSIDNNGLTYHLGDLGSKSRNDTFSIGITYAKSTPTLTVLALQPQPPPASQTLPAASAPGGVPAAPAATPSGRSGAETWLIVLVILLAAALGGTWLFMSRRKVERER